MGRRIAAAVALSAALFAVPAVACAEERIYFDPHPVHPAAGGGFCEEPGAHVHDYAPVDPGAFLLRDGLLFFAGDPVAFGYRGPVYEFEGSHEVSGSSGIATCSMAGIHYHLYAPAVVAVVPGATWFGGPLGGPIWWDERRPRRARADRVHLYPGPPPPVVREHRQPPSAAMRRSPVVHGEPRRRFVPPPAPPPPARRR